MYQERLPELGLVVAGLVLPLLLLYGPTGDHQVDGGFHRQPGWKKCDTQAVGRAPLGCGEMGSDQELQAPGKQEKETATHCRVVQLCV